MNRAIWREVRFSLYAAVVLNGILVQWVVPLTFKCSGTDASCPTCGLRTAVALVLQGRFREAYGANRLIAVVLVVLVGMVLDVGLYLRKRLARRDDQ